MAAKKGNKYAQGNKGGRPRTINPEDLKPFGEQLVSWAEAKFEAVMAQPDVALKMPFFMRTFCREHKVSTFTLLNYCKQDKEFFKAYRYAMDIITESLVVGGMKGWWNPKVFAFIAKNETDMRDKIEVSNANAPVSQEDFAEYR